MKQRILAILLSLTMMFTLVPTAWALSEEENRTPAPMATSENGEGAEGSGSVVAVLLRPCLESRHLLARGRAAVRLSRLRRQNEMQNDVNPARGDGQKIKKTFRR